MGMFDYFEVRYELPGVVPKYRHDKEGEPWVFQTKDFDRFMETIVLDSEGNLSIKDFTGKVEFYDDNIGSCGPGIYTSNGEDAENVTYTAEFLQGKLVEGSLCQEEYKIRPALPSRDNKPFGLKVYSEEEKAETQRRREARMDGRRFFIRWGSEGLGEGRWGKVVVEDGDQICFLYDKPEHGKRLFLMSKSARDHLFWDSKEAADERDIAKKNHWDKQKAEYDAYAEQWYKNNPAYAKG